LRHDAGARDALRSRPHPMTLFVRWILPVLICIGGIVAIIVSPDNAEAGAMIIGAGLSVWLLNLLYRVGVTGDRDRQAEDRAREYFDRHGHWPDDS
jgi:hypothetical protein